MVAVVLAVTAVGCDSNGGRSPILGGTSSPEPTSTAAEPTASASTPTASTSAAPGPLAWDGCGGGFECARITVPLDYAKPAGATASLPLIRLRAANRGRRIGSLLTNPGGPGASGVDFVRSNVKQVFGQAVRDRFDIIGFDPRGVGESRPAVDCVDGPAFDRYLALDPTPDSPAEHDKLISGNRTFVSDCLRRTGPLLRNVGTIAAARDMDAIRAALGESTLSYVGFSYGTYLGAVYAHLFPTRVRAVVLDGAVDPARDAEESALDQARGFERALDAFLADCARNAQCEFRSNGTTPAALSRAFDEVMATIDRMPLRTDSSRVLGPDEALFGAAAALYSKEQGWPVLGVALARAQRGDGTLLLALSDSLADRHDDGTYSNLLEVLNAVNCLDKPAPRSLSTIDRDAASFARVAPRFGAALAYGNLTCALWPVPPQPVPARLTAKGAPPIVVVGTTRDPATPYSGAQSLASMLASGVLLTYDGDGHTAYGFGRSNCINAAVDAYLVDRKVPPRNTVCRN
jgi:pimeloyl-ACP methyl ester carboxylesterase